MTDLDASAPLARAWAAELCPTGPDGCDWHHGLWQDLRRLSLVSTPDRHAAFFARELAGARRVLVSGAADYGMLEPVLAAAPDADVVVLDRCRTPLALCDWYARRHGREIRTVHVDALAFDEVGFDRIVTHSFLPFFSPAQRPALLARWRDALAPGGRIATTNRIDPRPTPDRRGFSADDAAAFVARVREAAAALDDPDAVAAHAAAYARYAASWPIRSTGELQRLLDGAGLGSRVHPVELPGGRHGPGTRQHATYVEIVAWAGRTAP